MIHIKAKTANAAWIDTFSAVYQHGSKTDNEKYFRDEVVLIEVTDPVVLPADIRFPMSQADLDFINDYIVTGHNEDKVVHEWTKLYHHRIFDQPNSQMEHMLACLQQGKPVGEAQISMWDKNVDQYKKVAPCTQIIWARIKHGKLELHVHAHSSDVYKKLLMNMLEFIAVQHYIANKLSVPVGSYFHFLDSGHLHNKDASSIKELKESIK